MLDNLPLLLEKLPVFALEIGVAILCGLLLGIERERKDKPAGLRTIMLITVGSTIFMIASILVADAAEGPSSVMLVDPSRIAAGVVTGIGFLGAGTIIQARGFAHGLTTAAVIWVAAGIGLCIGLGFPLLGLGLTLVNVMTLLLLDPVNRWFTRRNPRNALVFVAPDDSLALDRITYILRHEGVREEEISMQPAGTDEVRVETIYYASGEATQRLLAALANINGVRGVRRYE